MSQLLTRAEAAARLGLKPQTLANWRSAGKGPAVVKIGSLAQYEETEIERFIDEHRQNN